eukprot:6211496-Pleurochrysis_carterae.AAC.1
MRTLLGVACALTPQWLAVSVPRETNTDAANRLSHPAELLAILEEARAAGLQPHIRNSGECWGALRPAMRAGGTNGDGGRPAKRRERGDARLALCPLPPASPFPHLLLPHRHGTAQHPDLAPRALGDTGGKAEAVPPTSGHILAPPREVWDRQDCESAPAAAGGVGAATRAGIRVARQRPAGVDGRRLTSAALSKRAADSGCGPRACRDREDDQSEG